MENIMKTVLDVSENVKLKMEEFQQRLEQVKQSPLPAAESCPLAKDFEMFRTSVLFCLQSLQAQTEMLLKMQDDSEMRSRRKCLLLHGVNESKDESPASIARMISVLLNCPTVGEASFSRCHRLGSRTRSKPPPILIRFKEMEDREKIWTSKTKLKGTGITLSEFLTKSRHNIFMAARKKFGVSKSWTQEGRIFVIDANGARRRIIDMKDIDTSDVPNPKASHTAKPKSTQGDKPASKTDSVKS